uniref:Uncharacterized protein n=1 Tax=Oryza brachyantha TaxID=4533 RepID=J3MIY1_ORYBR
MANGMVTSRRKVEELMANGVVTSRRKVEEFMISNGFSPLSKLAGGFAFSDEELRLFYQILKGEPGHIIGTRRRDQLLRSFVFPWGLLLCVLALVHGTNPVSPVHHLPFAVVPLESSTPDLHMDMVAEALYLGPGIISSAWHLDVAAMPGAVHVDLDNK